MILRRLLTITILLTSTIWSLAQQINPVPDYVFRNQMSVGRNAVTDTAAYFSIGPRYGATKGFMPPIVGDTATFSSGKRNGLLIFSVQKNKFLYWDSVRVQWSDMAGSSGSYIVAGDTSAMLAPYLRKVDTTSMLTAYLRKGDTSTMLGNYVRHAGYGLTKSGQSFLVDTLNIATRAWRQKGLDSLAALEVSGSGTTNYVPKFTAGSTIGNSQIFDNGTNVGVGNNNPATAKLQITGPSGVGGSILFQTEKASGFGSTELFQYYNTGGTDYGSNFGINVSNATNGRASIIFKGDAVASNGTLIFNTNNTERLRITSGGNVGINDANPTDMLVVNGRMRVNGTNRITFGNSSGGYAGIGVTGATTGNLTFNTFDGTSDAERLRIFANGRVFIGASPTDAGYQLDVNGTFRTSGSAAAQMAVNTTNASGTALIHQQSGSSVGWVGNGGSSVIGGSTSDYGINSQASLFLATGGYRAATVTLAGDMGIGTSSPSYKLDINGTLRSVNGANFATTSGNVGIGVANPDGELELLGGTLTAGTVGTYALLLGNSSRQIMSLGTDANHGYIQTWGSRSLNLNSQGNNTIINSGSGEVLIGTTSDAGDYKLQVSGNIYNTGSAVLAATSGIVGIGTTSPTALASTSGLLHVNGASTNSELHLTNTSTGATATDGGLLLQFGTRTLLYNLENSSLEFGTNNTERGRINSAGEWIIDASGTDAGDYKLQVVGNARVGTGKLDIASNTTFGLGVARSGTSEVAGQIYNSSGILYFGAESSAGGQIFSGSSAYAGVIGTGANYPLQFAVNNITRGGFSTSGNLLLGFTTDSYFLKLQVNGSIFTNNQFFGQGANAQLSIDSSTNISPLYVSAHSLTGSSAQGLFYGSTTWNTTGNPSLIDLAITNTASGSDANYIKISDGSNIFRVTKAAEVVTAAPTGGSIRKWKLGEAATVSPTSPNRTIRVEIDGTVYYLHAKTTND